MSPELLSELDMPVKPEVVYFYAEPTSTFSSIVEDLSCDGCAVIALVMDIDFPAGRTGFDNAAWMGAYIKVDKRRRLE